MIEKNFVKIYGCRRTGTNFIQQLVKLNCPDTACYDNQFGNKHDSPVRDLSKFMKKTTVKYKKHVDYYKEVRTRIMKYRNLHSIIIIKNPYSWYSSIKNYIRKRRKFDDQMFVTVYNQYKDIYTACRDFYPNPTVFGEWYGKAVIVKYEDLLTDTKTAMLSICDHFGLPLQENLIVPSKIHMSAKFTNVQKQFYLREDNFDLSIKKIQTINKIIDHDLTEFYGYKRLEK